MSTIKDYSIIKTEWINERINIYKQYVKQLEFEIKNKTLLEDEIEINVQNIKRHKAILSEYEVLKSKLKPLTPIIIQTFQDAREFDSLDGPVDIDIVLNFGGDVSDLSPRIANSEDYINNTIIE